MKKLLISIFIALVPPCKAMVPQSPIAQIIEEEPVSPILLIDNSSDYDENDIISCGEVPTTVTHLPANLNLTPIAEFSHEGELLEVQGINPLDTTPIASATEE